MLSIVEAVEVMSINTVQDHSFAALQVRPSAAVVASSLDRDQAVTFLEDYDWLEHKLRFGCSIFFSVPVPLALDHGSRHMGLDYAILVTIVEAVGSGLDSYVLARPSDLG